jgi:bifunctional DNA-binding transcriptional regulator/antitoxin component of YhaV-PrlF toxin-antitoxin module
MSKIGVIKELDKLGRVVIPKELRERYGFYKSVEIIAREEGILIKNPEYFLQKKLDTD